MKENGELLSISVKNGFELFITMDKNLRYQQNLKKFPITIFVINMSGLKVSIVCLMFVFQCDFIAQVQKDTLKISSGH